MARGKGLLFTLAAGVAVGYTVGKFGKQIYEYVKKPTAFEESLLALKTKLEEVEKVTDDTVDALNIKVVEVTEHFNKKSESDTEVDSKILDNQRKITSKIEEIGKNVTEITHKAVEKIDQKLEQLRKEEPNELTEQDEDLDTENLEDVDTSDLDTDGDYYVEDKK